MKDILKDVAKHTHGLGIINAVKVTTDENSTSVDAMDDDRTVVLRGNLHNRVEDFDGKFGLGRLGVLSGYLNFATFDVNKGEEVGTTVSVRREERNGEVTPTELDFTAPGGFAASYRVISSTMVDEQIRTANFKGAKWDVDFVPSQQAVKDLQYCAGVLSSYDPLFTVSTDDGNLIFTIGDASTDKVDLPFAKNVGGTLSASWSFPLSTVLTILRLGDTSQMNVKISDQGAMMIAVDSGLGLYEYILPAKTGN